MIIKNSFKFFLQDMLGNIVKTIKISNKIFVIFMDN